MMTRCLLLLALLLPGLACGRETPRRIENESLGVAATFPGEAKLYRRDEPTPFGMVGWFDLAYVPTLRMDESYHVEVGNLPPGSQGGSTPAQVAATFEKWLRMRFGSIQRTDLPAEQGPGFRYTAKGPNNRAVEGVLVIRRGRLHHAQGTAPRADDPRLRNFIDGFTVK
jgi:hypothetical protein